MDIKSISTNMVNQLIHDISDRKGIGDEFDNIDDDIKQEIIDTWCGILEKILEFEVLKSDTQLSVAKIMINYLKGKIQKDNLTDIEKHEIIKNINAFINTFPKFEPGDILNKLYDSRL